LKNFIFLRKPLIPFFMKKPLTFFIGLSFLCFSATVTAQTTITINPEKDNTLFESATGALSAGADQNLFSGRTQTGLLRRAVMMFDIASNIPAGSVITNATLTLEATLVTAGTVNFSLHVLTADWGEAGSTGGGAGGGQGGPADFGDATWLHTFFDTDFWIVPGGDYNPTVSASTPVSSVGSYNWNSTQLTADVQDWLDNPSNNYGWILIGDETTNQTAKRFASRENTTALMPSLSITYSIPCTAPDVPLLAISSNTICTGNSTTISAIGNLNDATEWFLYSGTCGGTFVSSNSTGTFVVNPVADTDYFVRGEGGCVTPGACESVSVTVISVDTSVTQSMATLTATTSGATYQWVDCNNGFIPLSGATNQSYTAAVNGNYAVIINVNGCIDTSSCHEVIIIGIDENKSGINFNVFPNPFSNELTIELTEKISSTLEIQLINSSGKLVKTINYNENEKINTAILTPGIYLVRIKEIKNNKVLSEKTILKQ
jgi:hypothetical protein